MNHRRTSGHSEQPKQEPSASLWGAPKAVEILVRRDFQVGSAEASASSGGKVLTKNSLDQLEIKLQSDAPQLRVDWLTNAVVPKLKASAAKKCKPQRVHSAGSAMLVTNMVDVQFISWRPLRKHLYALRKKLVEVVDVQLIG
eukprot:Skav208011  [mRNA]  locus=scaffold320:20455:23344:- [translate_table: standard]